MKKRFIKIFTKVIGIGVSLSIISTFSASALNDLAKVKYSKNEKDIVGKIYSLDTNTLLTKANENFIKGENSIEYATAVAERINDLEESNILDMIKCNDKSTVFKVNLIQSYESSYENKSSDMNEELISLLQTNADNDIKENIIISCDFSNKIELLKDITNANDHELSPQAFKKLAIVDFDSALTIANNVISNESLYCENMLIRALKVKTEHISEDENVSITEINNFTDKCKELVIENGENNSLGLAAKFALIDIDNENAITFLLNSDKINYTSKIYAVGQNCNVLMDMIKSNNKDKIEIAVQSMTIYPLNIFYNELIKLRENHQFDNIELLNEAISLIESEGEDVIDKETGEVLNETTLDTAKVVVFSNPNPESVDESAAYVTEASRYQGYAVYRDGAVFDLTWHAAIMAEPLLSSSSLPIIHIPGVGYEVIWDSWANFLGSNDYMGVYKPKTKISKYQRANVVSIGQQLTVETITYTLANQISYSSNSNVVMPFQITRMRCDGVVEYCYEYLGIRIAGDDSNWDISINNQANRSAHSGNNVTPDSQAEDYMTRMLPPSVEPDY